MENLATVAPNPRPTGASGVFRRLRNWFVTLPALFVLAACSGQWATDYGEPLDIAVSGDWKIHDVTVTVPETLTVSERNTYTPNADIVWHGDPPGDRYQQVYDIVHAAGHQAIADTKGSQNARLNIEVVQFHGITPITRRRAPEAVHNVKLIAQVVSMDTGAALTPATQIRADLPALTGSAAVYADQYGPSQKKRISDHLVATLRGWLGLGPDIRGEFKSLGR